jgi:hypothetical protein
MHRGCGWRFAMRAVRNWGETGGQGRNRATDTRIFSPLLYPSGSGFLRHNLAVLPYIHRGSIHSRNPTSGARRPSQCTPNFGREDVRFLLHFLFPSHGPRSFRRGIRPELSYTAQASANGRYTSSKLCHPRTKRLSTSSRGTSWPPWRVLSKAKSEREAASRFISRSTSRPAATAARRGSRGDSPPAMRSALMK